MGLRVGDAYQARSRLTAVLSAEAGDTEPQKCRHAIYHSDCDWCNAHDVEAEAGDTDD
jgi:hypothetical protein